MGSRHNVLVIVADQLRYDCIGYAGQQPVRTPHLDQLAESGVWFEHAYAHTPICSPARQSFMNGRRPEAFGGHWNFDLGPRVSALSPSDYAWPRELARLGYQSAFIGKWHVSPTGDPTSFGFDEYQSLGAYDAYLKARHPNLRYAPGFIGEVDPLPLEDTETHVLARWTCDKIEAFQRGKHPWHIHLHLSVPHLPCRPVAQFAQLYSPDDIEPWPSFAEVFEDKPYIQRQQLVSWQIEHYQWQHFAPMVARYFAMVSQVDDAVGRVLDTLDQVGAADNTMVVFTSDHGDLCGAHRMLDKHYVLYDDVVRVPLIIRYPEKGRSGRRIAEFVYNFLDLPPTILDRLEASPEGVFHGQSLLPLVSDDGADNWRRDIVATYHGQQFGLYSQRMIRTHDWKYIWNATDTDELYDLQTDPAELVNRVREPALADTLKDLRERLYCQLVAQGDRQLDNEWVRRQLLHGRKL